MSQITERTAKMTHSTCLVSNDNGRSAARESCRRTMEAREKGQVAESRMNAMMMPTTLGTCQCRLLVMIVMEFMGHARQSLDKCVHKKNVKTKNC